LVYRKFYVKRGCLVTVDNKISSDSERRCAALDERVKRVAMGALARAVLTPEYI
jgi:hypothetical protein